MGQRSLSASAAKYTEGTYSKEIHSTGHASASATAGISRGATVRTTSSLIPLITIFGMILILLSLVYIIYDIPSLWRGLFANIIGISQAQEAHCVIVLGNSAHLLAPGALRGISVQVGYI